MRENDEQLQEAIRDALDRRLAYIGHTSGIRQERIMQKIREEGEPEMKKKISAGMVLVAALVLLSIAALAASIGKNALREKMEIGEREEQWIEELGISTIGSSVAQNGVTVTCEEALVDRFSVMIALRVEGFVPPNGEQPDFEEVELLIDGVSLYDALGTGGAGNRGSYLIGLDENGKELYIQEDGTWEETISRELDEPDLLFGKKITIRLKNLGYYSGKAWFTTTMEGEWVIDVQLGNAVSARILELSGPVGDTGAVVRYLELAPLSMYIEFDWPERYTTEMVEDGETGEVTEEKFLEDPGYFLGFELKDGTRMLDMEGGVSSGPIENGRWQKTITLNRMIDPNEVTALLFQQWDDESGTVYVVPIEENAE